MKEFNRNWNHITSEKINVGDLVWWNFGSSWSGSQDWKLCIITDTHLDKADQKTNSQWWNYTHPSGRWNQLEELNTNFVENTSRDKCKFNSITMHCPQEGKKIVVLLHPTYKEKWRTNSLKDFFMTQTMKKAEEDRKNHNRLVHQKRKELVAYWREENKDFFEGFDKDCEEANAGRARPRTYYVYDWVDGGWRNHLQATYNADKEVYEEFMKSLETKSASAMEVLNQLNNLIPDRLQVKQFTNGVEIDDGKVKGRIDVKWRWSMEKTRQWFEDYLNKDFDACGAKVRNWITANCNAEVAKELLNDRTITNIAFTPEWFWDNVLSHNERQWLNDNPDETLRCSENPNVIGNRNSFSTSGWNYDID